MSRMRALLTRDGGYFVAVFAALTLAAPCARAAIAVPSDGSDGAFNPTSNVEIDLSLAVTGQWDDNNAANAGKGVYEPEKWAVVFKYASVNIPAGITVTFKNHLPNAPVVWLVQGDVTISGTVDVSGKASVGPQGSVSEPGPGGFRGGAGAVGTVAGSAGFGPGGGRYLPAGQFIGNYGSFGTKGDGNSGPTYASAPMTPLIGGSGASQYTYDRPYNGGSGGGAILIAAGSTMTLSGRIAANGGAGEKSGSFGSGSGGGIRLVADTLNAASSGTLSATGARSGNGRVRIEMNQGAFNAASAPSASFALAGATPSIWPASTAPSLAITKVGSIVPPADPAARLDFPNQDISLPSATPVVVTLNATNVPLDWKVYVRVIPRSGEDSTVDATLVTGNAAASVWQATVTPSQGFSAIQARAYKP